MESLHLQGHREATVVMSHISESELKEKLKTILNINYPLNEKQMSGTLTCWGKASISNVWDIHPIFQMSFTKFLKLVPGMCRNTFSFCNSCWNTMFLYLLRNSIHKIFSSYLGHFMTIVTISCSLLMEVISIYFTSDLN